MLFDSYGKYIFYDGAMGTMLYKYGLRRGDKPDLMNLTAPEIVEKIHRMYIEAGSDIILTNTFGSNAFNLRETGYSPKEVITAAVANAARACRSVQNDVARVAGSQSTGQQSTKTAISLDIGPIGELIEPYGNLEYNTAYDMFKEMAVAGENAGVDFVSLETMSDLTEVKAAMSAVSDNTKLPILVTMTFEKSGRTFMGCSPESFVETAQALGAAALGINCSLEPVEMLEIAEHIASLTKLPLIIKPNAGLPDEGIYNTDAVDFAEQMSKFKKLNPKIIGGCCGTTPEYIKELKTVFSQSGK